MFCDDCKNDVDKLYQLVDGEKLCWDCFKNYLKNEWIDDIALLCKDEIIDYMDVIEIRQ